MDRKTLGSVLALLAICMLWVFISLKDLFNPNYMILRHTNLCEFPHKAKFTKSVNGNKFYIKIDEVGLKLPIINYSFSSNREVRKLIESSKESKSTKFTVSELNGEKYAYNIALNENTYFSREKVEIFLERERWLTWFFLIVSFLMIIFGILLITSKKSNPRADQALAK
jgi:hypothetical protein